jgi:isocitrate dehydrogenase kinase/phosphatase
MPATTSFRAESPSDSGAASAVADIVVETFAGLRERFDELTARAARHFAERDWHAAHRDATARLLVYSRQTDAALTALRETLGEHAQDCAIWSAAHAEYAARIAHRTDHEIAATFFNSVSRRVLGTVGVDRGVEFVAGAVDGECRAKLPLARVMLSDGPAAIERVLRALPMDAPWRDVAADAATIHQRIARPGKLELITTLFYRNKGAYLVGRIVDESGITPAVIALLHREEGVFVDAVITTSDEASIVFGFSWSYFQVAAEDPGAVVAFLASIMPLKRIDELYTAIGFHKHGKTELYRGLINYLKSHDVKFERAIGQPGLVMTVFALPSFNLVVKIIRDTIGYPKRVTRREVMAQYRFVFLRDRVGRLADAQEFERLELPRSAFPDDLLADLMREAPSSVRVAGNNVVIAHAYAQRRLIPLDVYLRTAADEDARAAVRDYGQAIADLAHAGIFPGDMLLKNFGLSRHGRVIFYDYDEIEELDDVVFREMPSGTYEDEISDQPWFSVGEHDAFPEEFVRFLLPDGPLREEFAASHGELLTARWWNDVQCRIRAGELFDVYPYRGITGNRT